MRTFWRKLVSSRTSGVRKRYSLTGSQAFEGLGENSKFLGVRCEASFDPVKVLLLICCSLAAEASCSISITDFLKDFCIIWNCFFPFLDLAGLIILNSLDLFELLLLASLDTNCVNVSFRRIPLDLGMWTTAFLRQEFARLLPGVLLKLMTSYLSASFWLKILSNSSYEAYYGLPYSSYAALGCILRPWSTIFMENSASWRSVLIRGGDSSETTQSICGAIGLWRRVLLRRTWVVKLQAWDSFAGFTWELLFFITIKPLLNIFWLCKDLILSPYSIRDESVFAGLHSKALSGMYRR